MAFACLWHSLVSLPLQDSLNESTLTEEKIIQFNPFIPGDLGERHSLVYGIRLFLYLSKTLLTTLTEEKIIQFNPFIPGDLLRKCQALLTQGIRLHLYLSKTL